MYIYIYKYKYVYIYIQINIYIYTPSIPKICDQQTWVYEAPNWLSSHYFLRYTVHTLLLSSTFTRRFSWNKRPLLRLQALDKGLTCCLRTTLLQQGSFSLDIQNPRNTWLRMCLEALQTESQEMWMGIQIIPPQKVLGCIGHMTPTQKMRDYNGNHSQALCKLNIDLFEPSKWMSFHDPCTIYLTWAVATKPLWYSNKILVGSWQEPEPMA